MGDHIRSGTVHLRHPSSPSLVGAVAPKSHFPSRFASCVFSLAITRAADVCPFAARLKLAGVGADFSGARSEVPEVEGRSQPCRLGDEVPLQVTEPAADELAEGEELLPKDVTNSA